MKIHPAAQDNLDVRRMSMQKLDQKIQKIVAEVSSDEDDRTEWVKRQDRYYLRRYARSGRNVDYPWPGASDIVIPTIDMTIDRVKSTISRVIFTKPMVNFTSRGQLGQDRINRERQYFEWLLSKRVRGFRKETKFLLDDILQTGIGIAKVSWEFRTEIRWHVLKREHIPKAFRQFLFRDPDEGNIPLMPEEVQQQIQQNPEILRKQFKESLNLDQEEPDDKEAITQVEKLFKGQVKEVRYKTREVLANNPRLDAISYPDFIVPACTNDIQLAPRLTHKIFLTEAEFLSRARDEKWKTAAVQNVLEKKRAAAHEQHERNSGRQRRGDNSTDDIRRNREGLYSDGAVDLIEIWEHYRWEDLKNPDKPKDPHRVVYLIHPGTNTALKDPQGLFYSHGMFPFVDIRMEENSTRFYSSRGLPEKIDDIDHEITQRHRAKLNKLELMVPTFKYRQGSNLNPHHFRFRPGAFFPVLRMDDIESIQIPDYTFQEEREENTLETMIQRYIGALDTGLTSNKSMSEARTATEISAIQRSATEALSARIEIIQDRMRLVYQMMWDLENQWGNSETFRKVTNGEKERLTSEQIKWDFQLDPEGTVMTKDPQMEEQKALQRLDILLKLGELPPEALGYKWKVDIGEALNDWLLKSTPNNARRLLPERSEEEIQQMQQERQAAVEAAKKAATGDTMTPQEMQTAVKEGKQVAPNSRIAFAQRGAG